MLSTLNIFAQKSHTLYVEILGNGLLGSLNYDFAPNKKNKNFRARIGLGAIAGPIVITQGSYLIGKERHFLELGLGVTALIYEDIDSKWTTEYFLNGALQYRFVGKKGLLLRVGLSPNFVAVERDDDLDITRILWFLPGASLGYAF